LSVKVSICLPVYNADSYLNKLMPVLSESKRFSHYQVCFIDSGSTDNTTARLHEVEFASLKIIHNSDFDHGGTRSMAKDLCEGEIIVFLTQDALPVSVQDIERLVSIFKDESVGAAFGRQLPYEDTSLFGKHLRAFNYTPVSYKHCIDDKSEYGIKTAFLSNSFSAYRRSAMDNVGWFKNGLILGEDTYAGAKLLQSGYKIAYVANAQVYHSHSYTVWEEFKRYFDIGVFHQMENWILEEFGKPEGEGLRYIKSEINYLLKNKAYHLFPEFIGRNIMKYLGYKLGKSYMILPGKFVKAFSMHHRWWSQHSKR